MATYRPRILQQVNGPMGWAVKDGWKHAENYGISGNTIAEDGPFTTSHWAYGQVNTDPNTGFTIVGETVNT